ncbi:MAG TPA: gliding motility-associated C-terminal domain-containing protein [Anditalea sp.]|nr:gliding motility-associated C-terminal domain-containing protein [Anditalea sp.]
MGKYLLSVLLSFLCYNILYASANTSEYTDPPVVTISEPGFTMYPVGSGWIRVDQNITISDSDSPQLQKAEVILSNRLDGAFIEELSLSSVGIGLITSNNLVLNFEPFPNMTVTVTGLADVSVYERILRGLQYRNTNADATPGDRLATYTLTDDQNINSVPKSRIIRIEVPTLVIEEVDVVSPENGLYGIGDEININVKYSGNAFVGEGTPYILVNIGGKEVKAVYVAGSGTDQHTYQYIVEEGDLDMDGVEFAEEITLDGAVIVDNFNRNTQIELEINSSVMVDGIRPFVTTISTPADGIYGACAEDRWVFGLSISEEVLVDLSNGSPTLQLMFNSGAVLATYDAAASTSTLLSFNYQIQAQDADPDGIVIVRMYLNGALITDLAGNQLLDLDFQQTELPDTENIVIDTTPPITPEISGISEDTGISSTDGITKSQNLTISGTGLANSSLRVFKDGESIGEVIINEAGEWVLDYSSVTIAEGAYILTAISINESCVESKPSDPFNLIIDLTPPVADLVDMTVVLDLSGSITILAEDSDTGSSDNFTPNSQLNFTLSKETFTCEDLGENTVEVTITDLSGNSTVASITVTIVDNIAPVIHADNITLYLDENGNASFGTEELNVLVTDNCGVENFSLDKAAFTCADIGSHTVTLTVDDKSGNASEFEIMVTVIDSLAPIVVNAPVNIVTGSNESGNYIIPDFLADLNVTDNCGLESIVQLPEAGSLLSGFGTPHPINITVTDVNGNVTEIEFTITLVDRDILEILNPDIISVPWNTPLDDIPLPTELTVTLQNGDVLDIPVNWQMVNYNPLEPGLYQNEGTLVLPTEVFNPDNRQPTVIVMVEDKPLPIDIELDNAEFSMRISPNTLIGNFSTIDPSDDIHFYALTGQGADDAYFRIVDGVLYWNSDEFFPGRTHFTIMVSSTDRMGNVITKSFDIERILEPLSDLRLVNVFSPNNDGINDTWGAEVLAFYGKVRIMIYERSGKRVYYSTDTTERWDGKFNGQDVLAGTYYYIIEVESTGEIHRSVLTILRD